MTTEFEQLRTAQQVAHNAFATALREDRAASANGTPRPDRAQLIALRDRAIAAREELLRALGANP